MKEYYYSNNSDIQSSVDTILSYFYGETYFLFQH